MENRLEVKDYWKEKDIILGFSRRDNGLIAIGEKIEGGGERFIHIHINDLTDLLHKYREYIFDTKENKNE